MNIAVIVLRDGPVIVSQTEELEHEPRVHLIRPKSISGSTNLVLKQWPPYTDDTDILLRSEDLLTVCEPNERVLAAYIKKCGISASDLTSAPKQVILNEEPQAPRYEEDPDEYEPQYLEEL